MKKNPVKDKERGRTPATEEARAEKRAAKPAAEKRKKAEDKMFSRFHYLLLMAVCGVLRLKFRAKSRLSPAFLAQKKEGAMLVLSNHVSPFDFAWFTTPFLGKKVSFVVAETMKYSQPVFAGLIDGYHAIVKKQFYADYTCIKNIKRYLEAGISVILCPEGKVSADGRTAPMAFAVAKLVKWLGFPVASCVISGAGLTRPKWAHSSRKGRVVCEMDMLMSAEDIAKLSAGEIMAKIDSALAHNEHAWQAENGVVFKGRKYAEGLENLLYRCPVCGEEFAMHAAGNAIMCEKCGFAAAYTRTGKIVGCGGESSRNCPARIDEWYDGIRSCVAAEVKRPGFALSEPVRVMTENEKGNGYRYAATGTLSLDREKLVFRAAEDDELKAEDAPDLLETPVSALPTVASLPGVSLDLSDGKHTYRMVFTARPAATKFALALEEMNAEKGL